MANVKVCDRCGKRLTDERSTFWVKPNRYTLTVALFKKPRYYSSIPDLVKTEHDLCVDCTSKLAEWLEHESAGDA